MASNHTGNTQPAIDQEEHTRISGIDGRKVFVFDNAGNQITDFGGSGSANATITLDNGVGNIGFATVTATTGTRSIGLVTLNPSSAYIGLVTNTQVGLVTLAPSPNYIGLVSIAQPINANVSLSNSIANIGFATVKIAANANTNIGLVTIDGGTSKSLVSLMDSVANIGFATVRIGTNANTNIGLVTIDGGTVKSLVSLGASVQGIGFATVAIGANVNTNIGLVTVDGGTVKSLVSLGASVQNIGFATIFQAFPGGATVFTQVISLTSTTTICVAPASNLFFIKNLHISSLGRSEVEIRSGATTLIPFTSLSTTSGINPYFGEYGLPGRAQADALVVNLAVGSATIAVMANVRFGV